MSSLVKLCQSLARLNIHVNKIPIAKPVQISTSLGKLSITIISLLKKHIFKIVKIDNFHLKKCDIFLIFAQNIDCGYTLDEAVLTSTHKLTICVLEQK